MFMESEIKSRGGVYSHTLKIRKQTSIFYKKHIQNEPMKKFGQMNGVASYFSHMVPRIVKVCLF